MSECLTFGKKKNLKKVKVPSTHDLQSTSWLFVIECVVAVCYLMFRLTRLRQGVRLARFLGAKKTGPVSVHQVLGDRRRQEFAYGSSSVQLVEINLTPGESLKRGFTDTASYFLPKGYPASVSAGYDAFVRGQMASMMFSTASGVLSMQSMLFALGLGVGSFPLAATLNWIIKDGLGQLGGVIFAGLVNNQFDADAKRWRMIASISLDVSSFIELLTPLAPGYFLPLAGFANVGKNVSFLAASATRAAIHKSFATHENLADVTAKTGSQCILSSLVGTGLGLSLAAALGGNYASILATFAALSGLSLGSTYFSLRGVTLTTLGTHRLDFIVSSYLDSVGHGRADFTGGKVTPVLLQPQEMTAREVYLGAPSVNTVPAITGADLTSALPTVEQLEFALEAQRDRGYLLNAFAYPSNAGAGEVHILFKEGSSKADVLAGAIHGLLLRRVMKQQGIHRAPSPLLFGWLQHPRGLTPATQRVWRKDCLELVAGPQTTELVDAITAALLAGSSKEASKSSESLRGSWLVEELLLESRYARISIPEAERDQGRE